MSTADLHSSRETVTNRNRNSKTYPDQNSFWSSDTA